MLARAKNLATVTSPVGDWAADKPGFAIVEGIVRAFLDHAESPSEQLLGYEFVWADHYRLRRICASFQTWDIAPKFRKPDKRSKSRPERLVGHVHQDRSAWVTDVTQALSRRDAGYDDTFEWVEEVARDLA